MNVATAELKGDSEHGDGVLKLCGSKVLKEYGDVNKLMLKKERMLMTIMIKGNSYV